MNSSVKFTKERTSDAGYTLDIIERTDGRVDDDVGQNNGFHTGLELAPPPGFYIEIVPSKNLVLQGYRMDPFVLNPEDRGEVVLQLYKVSEGPDLDLPCKVGLVMLHPIVHYTVSKCEDVDSTTLYGDLAQPANSRYRNEPIQGARRPAGGSQQRGTNVQQPQPSRGRPAGRSHMS